MISRIVKITFTNLLLFVLLTYSSVSGIVMDQVRYELKEAGKKDKGVLLIQNNKMLFKDTTNNVSTLFDFDKDQMIVLDHNKKTYTVIDPKEFVKAVEEYTVKMEEYRKKHLENLPPEQRELVEKMIKEREAESGLQRNTKIVISVKNTEQTEKIAGYTSKKYDVMYNENLNEEIWLTNDLNIQKELDINKMSSLMNEFKKVNKRLGDNSVKNEDAFINLFKEGGFPMKTIDHSFGESVYVEEVVDVNQKDIPVTEFDLPKGYEERTVQSLLQGAF
ncbi:MAG: DUF4412 domain-containing protein [Thermodesulfobacteriota bacterium]